MRFLTRRMRILVTQFEPGEGMIARGIAACREEPSQPASMAGDATGNSPERKRLLIDSTSRMARLAASGGSESSDGARKPLSGGLSTHDSFQDLNREGRQRLALLRRFSGLAQLAQFGGGFRVFAQGGVS